METPTDSLAMQRIQDGEAESLAILFERYHVALFRYLLHLTCDRAGSEDLVQEVFFRVLKYARTYDPGQPFPVWLFGIARNAHFDSLRKRQTQLNPEEIGELRSSDPMPEELFTRKQDLGFLHQALRQLPPDKRDVLVLSRFHNLRYDEIARVLQCEVGTVKVRVYRALKELRAAFFELQGEREL